MVIVINKYRSYAILIVWNLLTLTCEAPSYLVDSASPTIRNCGSRRQQTLTEHDPDIPWHLQTRCIRLRTACKMI